MNRSPDFVLPPSGYELTAFDIDKAQSATFEVYDASGKPFSLHVQTRASLATDELQREIPLVAREPTLSVEGDTIDLSAIGEFIMKHADRILPLLVLQDEV